MLEKEFREMVKALGKINHENLLPLRAYHYSKDEKLIVNDFVPMGSLSAVLHGNRSGAGRIPSNLDTRFNIAVGAARAIAHFHSLEPAICHGNIKSSNILLTRTFDVCVSDFGLANMAGLSGKDPTASHLKYEGIGIRRWILVALNNRRILEVFDIELLWYPNAEEDMVQLLKLAFSCTAEDGDNRPSMAEVSSQIEKICLSSSPST